MEIDSFPDPWSPTAFLAELDHNPRATYLVLRLEEKIVDYIGFWETPFGIDVLKLCISPESRGLGAGMKLLQESFCNITHDQYVRVLVRSKNAGALSFYKRNGFIANDVHTSYYTAPSDDAIELICWDGDSGAGP